MCIFCKIVSGEIPCVKIDESASSIAFLDVSPLSKGHLLVVPKQHHEFFHQLSPDEASDCMTLLNKIAKAMALDSYNILQNNGRSAHQFVPHVHFHLIPKSGEQGLGVVWNSQEISKEDLNKIGEDIRSKLQ
ncbi:hypothetical protein P9112_014338 [Eukaryota sp. TZLM1-RC]